MAVVRTFVMAVVRAQKPLFLNFGWFSQKTYQIYAKTKKNIKSQNQRQNLKADSKNQKNQ